MTSVRPEDELFRTAKTIEFQMIPTEKILPNPRNPRLNFKEEEIDELCASIQELGGIIVPLVVYPAEQPGNYTLLDGERRLMAAKKLGMKTVPANVIPSELTDVQNLSVMFNVHMQRVQWNTAARAIALGELMQLRPNLTKKELREITGMNSTEITSGMMILSFPEDLQKRAVFEDRDDGIKPAYLVEMGKALEAFQNLGLLDPKNRESVIRALVKKIDSGLIVNPIDFRGIASGLRSIPKEQASMIYDRVLTDPNYSLKQASADAWASYYKLRPPVTIVRVPTESILASEFESLKAKCESFLVMLDTVQLSKFPEVAREDLRRLLESVRLKIDKKLKE